MGIELVASGVTSVAVANGASWKAMLLFKGADGTVASGLLEHL